MNHYLNMLSSIQGNTLSRRYRQRILVSVALVGAGVSLCYACALWLFYANLYSAVSDLVFAAMYLTTFVWIRQRRFALSAYWLIFFAGLQVGAGSTMFVGADTGFHLYFLALPILIYLLLGQQPRWAQLLTSLYGAAMFIASHTVHIAQYQAPIPADVSELMFIANALIVFGMVFFAVKFFADELERAYQEQEKLVLTDALTGLANRRYVHSHAKKLFSLCERYGHPLSLILLDVRDFSSINQQYGRQTGDALLVALAQRLLADVRDADIVARIGGNEFLFVLPETCASEARDIANRLCEDVAQHTFPVCGHSVQIQLRAGISDSSADEIPPVAELIALASDDLAHHKSQ